MERFRMSPTVPSGPCCTTSTTDSRKFGSSSDGLATKSTPFSTDDGENSVPARAGTACRTVRSSPPSRKLAMAFRAPVRSGALEYSDEVCMTELPDAGEMASIGRGKETGTPIKMNQVQFLNQKIVPPNLLATFFKGWPGSVPTCARQI